MAACNLTNGVTSSLVVFPTSMNPLLPLRQCFVLLALSAAGVVGARAVDLTANSPFLPQGGGIGIINATQEDTPLELRGILATPDGYKFNLCDSSGHINVWLGLNAAGQPFVVRAQDIPHNSVTVEYQGRQMTLSLPQPKTVPMSIQTPMMMAPQPMMTAQVSTQGMQQPTLMQLGGSNASATEERRRLERIAQEIMRRRALRAGLQQQQFPPGMMPPQQ
jgi:hypothetical protein